MTNRDLNKMSLEELKKWKERQYTLAENRVILPNIAFIAKTLGTSTGSQKWEYEIPSEGIHVRVDDYDGYMDVRLGGGRNGKLVCGTHSGTRLFVPGPWVDAILEKLDEATLAHQTSRWWRRETQRQQLLDELTLPE